MHACLCSSPDCRVNGCAAMRREAARADERRPAPAVVPLIVTTPGQETAAAAREVREAYAQRFRL